MATDNEVAVSHPTGEAEIALREAPDEGSAVDTYGGKIRVKWDEEAAVTPFGQLVFFIEFLKTAGLWEWWVEECPVTYKSPNAPTPQSKRMFWGRFCCRFWRAIAGTR